MTISQTPEGQVLLTPDDKGLIPFVVHVEVIAATGMYAINISSIVEPEDEVKVIDQIIAQLNERKDSISGRATRNEGRSNPFDLLPIPKGPTSRVSDTAPDRSPIVSGGPIERSEPSDDRYNCPICGRHYIHCDH